MIHLYNVLIRIGLTIGFPIILICFILSEKRRKTGLYRLGLLAPTFKPALPGVESAGRPQKTIWIHALSVGEMISAVPMTRKIREEYPEERIVFSVSTLTGFRAAGQMLKDHADRIIFFPYDLKFSVRKMVNFVAPDIMLLVESDIWPNFMEEMRKRDIATYFVNARLSDRSYASYQRRPWLAKLMFSHFSRIFPQTDEDARRFEAIGVAPMKMVTTGNLKFDQESESFSDKKRKELRQLLSVNEGRRIWICGSTHEGEETIIAEAFDRIRLSVSDLMLVVAPRDPDRAEKVRHIFESAGFSVACLSETPRNGIERHLDVMIIDQIGLLRRLYAIADIALVGGSLCTINGIGGHNPIEPAAYAKPIIFGHNMINFRDIADRLKTCGGAVQVADSGELETQLLHLLSKPEAALEMGSRAHEVFAANRGTVDRTVAVISAHQSARIKAGAEIPVEAFRRYADSAAF